MKTIFFILCLLAGATATIAQTRIKASDIIQQINDGHDVSYTHAIIDGDLDLTNLANRTEWHQSDTRSSHFGGDGAFVSTVKVSLAFTDCEFTGSVLAYISKNCGEQTWVAFFEKNVAFRNCVFKMASAFKYSEFAMTTTFGGSTFWEVANFKYAEFANGPSFEGVKFESGADFKYTEFPRETSFHKATFNDLANFKYSKFTSPINLDGVAFNGGEDFKYTRMDGRSFRDKD